MTLADAARRVQALHDAAKAVRSDVLVLCHGGPIADPDDAAYVLANTRGSPAFFGASSTEPAADGGGDHGVLRRFKAIPLASG
ncbi:MAG: phosphoenolpyruvate hydrolase family protein [Gemmataceae bacterium]